MWFYHHFNKSVYWYKVCPFFHNHKILQVITRCIRKFAISSCGNFKVSTSKPSHTPNRYTQLKFIKPISVNLSLDSSLLIGNKNVLIL
jgi:hypothetical protein